MMCTPACNGICATKLMDTMRKSAVPIESKRAFEKIVRATNSEEHVFNAEGWERDQHAKELYQLMAPNLSLTSFTEFKDADGMNG